MFNDSNLGFAFRVWNATQDCVTGNTASPALIQAYNDAKDSSTVFGIRAMNLTKAVMTMDAADLPPHVVTMREAVRNA